MKKNAVRPQLKIAANYSQKVGKAILETIFQKSPRGAYPRAPYKTRTFRACYVPPQ